MPSLILSPEERQQEQEDVEDVQEDGCREQRGGPEVAAAAKALEVEGGQAGEDHQAKDRVEQRTVGNPDEDRDDAEDDQPDQGPEQDAGQGREVTAGGVAGGPEPGDEQRRRSTRLSDRLRVGACGVAERRRHREAHEHPEPEQEGDGEPSDRGAATFMAMRQPKAAMNPSQPQGEARSRPR